MKTNVLKLGILSFLIVWGFAGRAFSQNIPTPHMAVDCYETIKAWQSDQSLHNYMITHKCSCPDPNQPPVCTPISSSMPSTGTTKQQLQMQIMQSILQPLFNAIFDFSNLSPTPQQSQQETIRKQQEESMRQQQEMLKKKAEEVERKKRGEEILAKASIGGGGLKMESISGGTLTPFERDTKKDLSSISATGFPAPKTATEQLLCAAYFSKLASECNDMEGVRFYNAQMENVIQGLPTAIECKPPKELITGVDLKKASKLNKRYTEASKIIQDVTLKVKKLQDVTEKLEDAKEKKQESEEKIKEIDQNIEEIKVKAQTADTPEKKAEADDLLSQAMALKSDAEKQHQEAVQLEEKLNKEKENIENEINEIKNKMQKGEQK